MAEAARQAVEMLEARVFLHAGHDHGDGAVIVPVSPVPTPAPIVVTKSKPSVYATGNGLPLIGQMAIPVSSGITTSFSGGVLAASSTLKVTATTPLNGKIKVATNTNVTVTFNVAINATTINSTTFELRDANNNLVPAVVTYDAATRTATLNPNSNLATANTFYYAKVKGGSSGIKDSAGDHLAADYQWSFSTGTPAFTETTPFSNLNSPTSIEFGSDGRVFIAEKRGVVKVFDSLTDTTATTLIDIRTQVHNFWDRGLLGMALHPNFPQQPYIYLLYAYDGDIGGAAPKYGTANTDTDAGPDATGNGALISGRLSRFQVNANNTVGPEQVLIHDWAQQFPSHSIGTLAFGPDGMLYASGGDGASFNYADYGQTGNPFNDPTNEGGAVRSLDLRTTSDPTSLDGTIIRIDPTTGVGVAGNPLFNTGNDANAKRVVAYGLRNPLRFAFRPGTSEIYVGDVGWNAYEEINRLLAPTSSTLTNFGWPAYEGAARQGSYDNLNLPLIENLYAAGPSAHTTPFYAYAHSEKVDTTSSESTGGSSIAGMAFYGSGSYPVAYDGALFFADYSRQHIYVMFAGPDGIPDPASRIAFKAGRATVELQMGPGGDLFAVDYNTSSIRRYSYFASNAPPTADIQANPTGGGTPLLVNFNGTGSTDPDAGDTLDYAWDLDGDGQFDDSTSPTPSFTYTTTGNYTVSLRVTDRQGLADTDTIVINAGNTAPTASIATPTALFNWKVGDTVNFSGSATDTQQGTLPASALRWDLILHHSNELGGSHEHFIQSFTGVASGSFVAPDHEYPSWLELRLTATDAGGLTHTASRILQPQTTSITLATSPAGLQTSLGSFSGGTPFTRTVITGSNLTISAPSPQSLGGTTYTFVSWSDGGAATHNIVAPVSTTTYTATFAAVPTNTPPTVATPAAATPSPVTGTTTALSVLGADNGGEAALTYTWSVVTKPASAANPTFSASGTNAAKNATATFSKAGSYTLRATITDGGALSVTSDVTVVVNQTVTTVTVSPATASLLAGATQQFTALAKDQFGDNLTSQPSFAWTIDAGGAGTVSSSGFYTAPGTNASAIVRATASGKSGTASVTVSLVPDVTAGLLHRWKFDENATGTTADSAGTNNGTLTNGPTWVPGKAGSALNFDGNNDYVAVPQDLAATLGVNAATLTAWIKTTAVGSDLFWEAPGITGMEQAGDDEDGFWGWLDASGRIGIQMGDGGAAKSINPVNDGQWHHVAFSRDQVTGLMQVWVDGVLNTTGDGWQGPRNTPFRSIGRIEDTAGTPSYWQGALDDVRIYNRVLTTTEVAQVRDAGGSAPANQSPTVATPAAATPSPVTGTTTALSVLGADDNGEPGLTYTWAVTAKPAAAANPTFSANGTNAAKTATATFTKAGSYTFQVTISDGALNTTSSVTVTVNQTLTSIAVSPSSPATLPLNGTQLFSAVAKDQFGDNLTTQPVFTWSVSAGVGSISAAGLYTAPNTGGTYTVRAAVGAIGGTASGTVASNAPTVATAASATPSPVTGATTALSVLGADDGGEANLTYTWAVTAKPAGAADPTYSANGTNAAKNATATFTKAGSYTIRATISDGALSTASSVTVVVSQTLTSILVSPATPPTLAPGATQQFAAVARDQFGDNLATQPAFTWSVPTGVGSISAAGLYTAPATGGSYTVQAASGVVTGAASGTVATPPTVATPAAATPSPVTGTTTALSVLGAHGGGEAGLTYTWSITAKPAGVADPALSVNGTNAAKSATATFTKAGSYTFLATISDGALSVTSSVTVVVSQTLTSIVVSPAAAPTLAPGGTQQFTAVAKDQFGDNLATQPTFTWSVPTGGGTISSTGLYAAGSTGGAYTVEATSGAIVGTAGGTVSNPPTVATPAAATPSPVTGTTTALTVLGDDVEGEAGLTYTWSTAAKPAGAVDPTFSANGTNAAKNSTATFTKAGSYTFLATISDGALTVTSSVTVVVDQTLTSIVVSPSSPATLPLGGTQQFAAVARDQFSDNLAIQPTFTWSVSVGGGSVSTSGLYTAGATAGGYTVQAASGVVTGTASGTVASSAPTVATAASATPSPVTGTTTALSVLGADDGGEANLNYTWSITAKPAGAADPTFSANGTNAAKSATATFTKAGSYTFLATISDGALSVTSSVTVIVSQTVTTVTVSPSTASVANGATQQFAAVAKDQFGDNLATQPAFAWTIDAGGSGAVSTAGLYTAPATGTGSATVRATASGQSGTAAVTVTASTDDNVTAGLLHRWKFDESAGSTTAADSAGGNTGTLTNGPTFVAGKKGNALNFDGSNDYVAVPQDLAPALSTGTATLTTWIRTTQVGNDQFWDAPGITGAEQFWGDNDSFWGWLDASGRLGLHVGDGPVAKSTNPVNDGQWHHVALTRDAASGALQVYVDGVLNATVIGWQGARTTAFRSIGRVEDTGAAADHFQGSLDDVRIYNRVLSASEVAAIHAATGTGGGTPNAAPTVATAAAATPAAPTGTTTALSVLGADDGGEATLTYTWAVTAKPAGAADPTYSANGSNAAKNITATFNRAGSYTLRATISDGSLSTTSTVTVNVAQTLTSIVVSPSSISLVNGATQQFTAVARDQFAQNMATQPAFTWTKPSGVGTVSASGLYTAPASGTGTATVRAASGGINGNATVTVQAAGFTGAKINFQPAAAPTVSGYLVDGGNTYGTRTGGLSYGWSKDHTGVVRDRNVNSNQLLDTHVQVRSASNWEIAVPNGTYNVKISIGDATSTSINTVRVEGTSFWAAQTLATNVFANKTLSITVTDGRLTLDNNTQGNQQTRINYIEITPGSGGVLGIAAMGSSPAKASTASLPVVQAFGVSAKPASYPVYNSPQPQYGGVFSEETIAELVLG